MALKFNPVGMVHVVAPDFNPEPYWDGWYSILMRLF